MLESVEVRNFRGLDGLVIENLNRVNLFVGLNNSGKTSLLEALFLLFGAGSPHMALSGHVIRNLVGEPTASISETFWKPLFSALDTSKKIEIIGHHSSHGALKLCISVERSSITEIPLEKSDKIPAESVSGKNALLFSFKIGSKPAAEGRAHEGTQNFKIEWPGANKKPPFVARILSTQLIEPQNDAARLGELRKRKQGDSLLKVLKIIEPRLQSIEDNSASGVPMILGDIGLPELVPLAVMGEGMTRIARLILAISFAPDGLVLVDDIDTGLHHSMLPKIWKAVDEAAKQCNTQIVATTHSFECVQAAWQSLGDGFLLRRLEASDSGSRCITYPPKGLEAAIRHNLEVR